MPQDNTTNFGSTSSPGSPGGMNAGGMNAGGMNTGGMNAGGGTDTNAGAGQGEGIGGMARNLANEAKNKAGEQVRTSLDKGRSRAADTLHEVARTLMGTGDQADNPAAPYMSRAGEQVQRAADYLQNADLRQMVTQHGAVRASSARALPRKRFRDRRARRAIPQEHAAARTMTSTAMTSGPIRCTTASVRSRAIASRRATQRAPLAIRRATRATRPAPASAAATRAAMTSTGQAAPERRTRRLRASDPPAAVEPASTQSS